MPLKNPIKIRPYQDKDQTGAVRTIVNVLKEMFNCRKKEDLPQWLIEDLGDIRKNYFNQGGTFFVAEDRGKIVGTVAVTPKNKKTATLRRLYLNKKYRGQGLGSRLHDQAEKWSKKKGYKKMILFTFPHFKKAIAMYKYKGYQGFQKKEGEIWAHKKIN